MVVERAEFEALRDFLLAHMQDAKVHRTQRDTFTADGVRRHYPLTQMPIESGLVQWHEGGTLQAATNYTLYGRDLYVTRAPENGVICEAIYEYDASVESFGFDVSSIDEFLMADIDDDAELEAVSPNAGQAATLPWVGI